MKTGRRIAGLLAMTLGVVVGVVFAVPAAGAATVQTARWDFETGAVGTVPQGCATPRTRTPLRMSRVIAPRGSRGSLLMTETGRALPMLLCQQAGTASAIASFAVYPQRLANGFTVSLIGSSTAGVQRAPLVNLVFAAGGSVRWYDGAAWHVLASSGGPRLGRWNTVSLSVGIGANSVDVSVNGTDLGQGGATTLNPLTAFTGLQFAGTGTRNTGDVVFFAKPSLSGVRGAQIAAWSADASNVGAVPAGCSTPTGRLPLKVNTAVALPGSSRSLELTENGSQQPLIRCSAGAPDRWAGLGARLRFAVSPQAMPNGFLVDLMGSTTSGAQSNPIVRVAFRSDGSVDWYQGSEGFAGPRWLPVAPSGGPNVGQWNTVDITTTTDMDMAYVYVNGVYLGSAGLWSVNPATRVSGFRLGGVAASASGDNIYFGSPGMFPAADQRPAAVTSDYDFGRLNTIAASGGVAATPYQMPTAVVKVPLPAGGYQLVADYPVHTDSGATTGNEMVTSGNQGRTWRLASSNPMPDVPGLNLTRLSNGTLLATGFHTYAQRDGQPIPNNEAVAISAVSSDGGRTWSGPRYGIVTNSDAFDAYSCEVASGCQKLVFVHSVIEGADGTLYQSAYGQNASDPAANLRQYVLASTDGGLNWSVKASLTTASYPQGFAEGALAWAPDGSMIVVMRTGSYSPMYLARSSDEGATWSTPQQMSDAEGEPILSIYPNLVHLDNGSLLLLTGRPGMSLNRSTDGGQTWSRSRAIDYTDSGNGSMTDLGNNTVLVLGDRGADWSAPANPGVWCRQITVVGR